MNPPRNRDPFVGLDRKTVHSDSRLAYHIRLLEPTARGLKACHQLGVQTIQDFLDRERGEFESLRNCGSRTYDDLEKRVSLFLSSDNEPRNNPSPDDLRRPLLGLVQNPRAERAFLTLGITTVGEFLDTPKSRFLKIRGFGERTYWTVSQRVQQVIGNASTGPSLLPDCLLDYEISGLGLEARINRALSDLGVNDIRGLLEFPAAVLSADLAIDSDGTTRIRDSLDRLLRVGIDRTLNLSVEKGEGDFFTVMSEILSVLDEDQTTLFRQRVGLDCASISIDELGRRMSLSDERVRILEENTRLTLRERAPSLMTRMREEAHKELRAFEGILHCDTLAPGTLLHSAGKCTGDRLLPLRLLRFAFPREFYLYGELISTLPPSAYQRLRQTLHKATGRAQLPAPVIDVQREAEAVVDDLPFGLMMHVLETQEHLVVQIDPRVGEILHRAELSISDRLVEVLSDATQASSAEDILFVYRERHRRGNLQQLVDELRADPRCIQVGHEMWDLRERQSEALALARPEADTIIEILQAQPVRQDVFHLHESAGMSDHVTYMVIDCLRQDPRLRYMGRGVFVARGRQSSVMNDLSETLHRAMGEVVRSRLQANQHPRLRRLTAHLLRDNRAFIEPTPDRLDVITNYPLTAERLGRMIRIADATLDKFGGYCESSKVVDAIQDRGVGGPWFNDHFFLDLMHRNADFEILPGGIMARKDLGLTGWIQQRARECLRQADAWLTPRELMTEQPELAMFGECIELLLDQDPMIQCVDGDRYAIL